MKNMGLSRLRLVSPEKPLDDEQIRVRAVHGEDIWDSARFFPSLEEALADCSFIIGTTRRRGRHRKALTLTPEETAACLCTRPGPAALVFGNERTGLDRRELALCNMASHIPSNEAFPSLNLSHAVQIYAYALFRTLLPSPPADDGPARTGAAGPAETAEAPASRKRFISGQWVPMDKEGVDKLTAFITSNLARLGCYKQAGREEQERFLRDLCARAGLTVSEGCYLGNIFARAARLAEKSILKNEE
jgi:tRNA/rRNA methyltransferase/tRNA (cytidine32/uridine32-2'-O)-methyltransferase